MCPHVVVKAGGGAGGGSGAGGAGSGGGGSGGAPGGDGDGAGAGSPGGASGSPDGKKYKAASEAGEPIDPSCGRVTSLPLVDIALPGPLPLAFTRSYSSHFHRRDVGFGPGWTHTYAWRLERRRRMRAWTSAGVWIEWAELQDGPSLGPFGWVLTPHAEGYWLDADDGMLRDFRPGPNPDVWLLHAVRDGFGNRIALHYDNGNLAEIHDSVGRRVALSHDERGHLTALRFVRQQGEAVPFAHYEYDDAGYLVRTVDADGHAARYDYDRRHGLLTRLENRVGGVFHYRYDREHRCVESWGDDVGGSLSPRAPKTLHDGSRARGIFHVKLAFHPDGFTEVVSSRANKQLFTNAFGLVDKLVTSRGVLSYEYDRFGHLLAVTDPEGAVTRYERDPRGRKTATIDPLERVTQRELDEAGRTLRVIDPAGGITEIERERNGRPTILKRPDGAIISADYDERGLMRSRTDASGATTTYAYDGHANLVEIRHANGRNTQFTYDELGRTITRTNPTGATHRYDYSTRGDLIGETLHDGASARYTPDGEGRVIERVDPTGAVERVRWGGFHRMVETIDPVGGVVRLGYGREGELMDVVDESGAITEFDHDGDLNLVEERTFDGRRIRYRHDRTGLRTRIEANSGAVTLLEYDAAGQLIRREYDDGRVDELGYDARGLLVAARGADAAVEIERDILGRVVVERTSVADDVCEIRSSYASTGERARRETSRGHVLERQRANGKLHLRLDDTSTWVESELEGARWELGAGGVLEQRFDTMGDLVEQRVSGASTAATRHRYDGLGRWEHSDGDEHGTVALRRDPRGRLIEVVRSDGESESYRYDLTGNLIHDNQTHDRNRLVRRGDASFEYDDDGRLTRKITSSGVWRYGYTGAGQLALVEKPDGARVEHRYDPFARRVERIDVSPDGTASRTRFDWDRHALVHEQRDDDALRTYVFDEDAFAPSAHRDGTGGWRFYVNNPIGTPEQLVDGSGQLVGSQRLTSRGRLLSAEGETTPIRLQGQYADPGTGLHYNRHRFYDPELGRFITPDPAGIAADLNVFAAPGDPAFEIDPVGKLPTPHTVAKGGDKETARQRARERFEKDSKLKDRQNAIKEMSSTHEKAKDGKIALNNGLCQDVAEAARDKLGAGRAVNIHGEVPTDKDGNVTDWDHPATLKKDGGGEWVDHWVNQEPDGRIVDYDQGMVWDNRQQMVDNMYDNQTVYTQGYSSF